MQDHPTVKKLLEGVCALLESEIVPALGEPLRFHTRVAANLLKIIQREIEAEPSLIAEECRRLKKLVGKKRGSEGRETLAEVRELNEELCALIREGRADEGPWREDVIEHICLTLVDKLKVADPHMIERAQTNY